MNIDSRSVRVWGENYFVEVSCQSVLDRLSPDNGISFYDKSCEAADNQISCYVKDSEYYSYCDDALEELVNRDFYDWTGEKPTNLN